MKGLDGFATFVELRQRSPDVPIIFFSAYQDLKDPLQILNEFRPFGYVLKDGNPQTLADTLASAVAHYRQSLHNKKLVEELRELNATLEERVQQRTLELEAALKRLKQLTETDALTEIANRRHFFQVYEGLLNDSSEPPEHVSLVLIDVDHFKRINDRYGHPCGDLVLRTVASLLKNSIRSEDLVARIGGEEFAVLMPGLDSEAAMAAAERLRRAVAEHEFRVEDGRRVKVTISAGLCSADGVTPDAEEFYALADRALYAAKERGRDNVDYRPYGPMSENYPTSSG
jgi:diguanylate cyclase (GGDEF)-like protein